MCCDKIARTVKNGQRIATGFAYLAGGVNEELHDSRVKICHNCPKLVGGLVCQVCGCAVDAKTRLTDESCPIGKWKAI
jgi:hypothetical protein